VVLSHAYLTLGAEEHVELQVELSLNSPFEVSKQRPLVLSHVKVTSGIGAPV